MCTYDFTAEIACKVQENEEEFVFSHISRYLGQEMTDYEYKIPKRLLVRALECFKEEHRDEWDVYMGMQDEGSMSDSSF